MRKASAVSRGHQKRIKLLARCLLVLDCCQCYDEDHLRSKKILVGYYKLGHQIGFSFHIIVVTILKFALFIPFYTAISRSIEDLRRMDEAANLGEGLLESDENGRRGRKSRKGLVRLRADKADNSYRVERIQPGAQDPPNPYLPPSESEQIEGWSKGVQPDYSQKHKQSEAVKLPQPSSDEDDEPWGDWQGG